MAPRARVHRRGNTRFLQLRQRPSRQVVGAERVLEASMRGAGIDEEGVAQLAHVTQALDGGRIDQLQRVALDPDVVPQEVADDFERAQRTGPASATAACAVSATCAKFLRNISANFLACASYAAASRQLARGRRTSSGTPGTCCGPARPNTGSVAVPTRSSLPARAAPTIPRVSGRGIPPPRPLGPPGPPGVSR